MTRRPSRRDILNTTMGFAAAGSLGAGYAAVAHAHEPTRRGAKALVQIDEALRIATTTGELPGVVALATTDNGLLYEGFFGLRWLNAGPAMTRDTVFRVASMIKPITSVAALQLVEQGKLSLDAPVPDIEPVLGSPQVLDGFDAAGIPQLRPARRPISLRQLLTQAV